MGSEGLDADSKSVINISRIKMPRMIQSKRLFRRCGKFDGEVGGFSTPSASGAASSGVSVSSATETLNSRANARRLLMSGTDWSVSHLLTA